ncbi:MAG: hypothetical protein ACOH1K_01370 [Rhodoglobus sp.]
MNHDCDVSLLAAKLPGSWSVAATNSPLWIDGTRHNPQFDFDLMSGDGTGDGGEELAFGDTVSFSTTAGEKRSIVSTSRLNGDEFIRRGRGVRKVLPSRWRVIGASTDFDIVVIRVAHSFLTPGAIDVLVHSDAPHPTVRSTVASSTDTLGLSIEDFASLTWLS